MRSQSLVLASLLLATITFAKEPKAYVDGKLLMMNSVQCGTDDKDVKKGKTHELLCQEYVVQTDQVLYTVQTKDNKHPELLPVGQNAQFRLDKNKMLLRVPGFDGKERDYLVVSIKPRSDSAAADASPAHPNHLQ